LRGKPSKKPAEAGDKLSSGLPSVIYENILQSLQQSNLRVNFFLLHIADSIQAPSEYDPSSLKFLELAG
jgi:hypothetical protein